MRAGNAVIFVLICIGLAGCQTEPTQYALTPAITVYAGQPDQTQTVARTPPTTAPRRLEDPTGGGAVNAPNMVFVPGGFTQVGAEDGQEWEKPVFRVKVDAFRMDEHPVTVAEFRRFVQATHHQTEAEKFGDAALLDEVSKQWTLEKGANWRYPQGTNHPPAPDTHPVTQVSWNDAQAYARWAGKRLPNEFEWEHAARNAVNSRSRYPFGNDCGC